MQTIRELQHKVFYRVIKVIFIFFLIGLNVFLIFFIVKRNSGQGVYLEQTEIICKMGLNKEINAAQAGIVNKDDFWKLSTLQKACQISRDEIEKKELELRTSTNFTPKNVSDINWDKLNQDSAIWSLENNNRNEQLEVHATYHTIYDAKNIMKYLLLSVIASGIMLELMRRIVYYITLGKFKPKLE